MSDDLFNRAKAYKSQGYDFSHALELAAFEARIDQWPSNWGDDFVALVYGDFKPPQQELTFDQLGITIEPKKLEKTVIRSALTVLNARVTVKEKSIAAVHDAAKRLNLLMGVLSVLNQGAPVRWWSFIVNPTGGGFSFALDDRDPDGLLALVRLLPETVRRKVTAAFYWIREPRGLLLEQHRDDHLAVYAGYWNAFELLVDAANDLEPRAKVSHAEKIKIIRERVKQAGEFISTADIIALYQDVIDPRLRAKAEHAIRMCTGSEAGQFIADCFEVTPSSNQLYTIRNAINHGTVDVDDPSTAILVNSRFAKLSLLVFSMLHGLLRHHLSRTTNTSSLDPKRSGQ